MSGTKNRQSWLLGAVLLLFSLLLLPAGPEPAGALAQPSPTPITYSFSNLGKEDGLPYESIGPTYFLPWINPLTGLQVENTALLERRPMAIKVTNYPRGTRPPSGLAFADVVYEYYTERHITRYIAIYYGQDADRVGPIRSGRLFDEHIFNMYDASFAFGYADALLMERWREQGPETELRFALEGKVDHLYDCVPGISYSLCRDRSLQTYNNLFAATAALNVAVEAKGLPNIRPDLTGLRFAHRPPEGGFSAERLYFRYSVVIYNRWDYSEASGQYLRYQETQSAVDVAGERFAPLREATTGQHLAADNVVALVVPHRYFMKTEKTEIIQVDFVGVGDAVVFRDGLAYPARWLRPTEGGIVQLFTPDGEPFPLKPGQTWYQVVSLETEYGQDGNQWRFNFSPPPEPEEPIWPPSP